MELPELSELACRASGRVLRRGDDDDDADVVHLAAAPRLMRVVLLDFLGKGPVLFGVDAGRFGSRHQLRRQEGLQGGRPVAVPGTRLAVRRGCLVENGQRIGDADSASLRLLPGTCRDHYAAGDTENVLIEQVVEDTVGSENHHVAVAKTKTRDIGVARQIAELGAAVGCHLGGKRRRQERQLKWRVEGVRLGLRVGVDGIETQVEKSRVAKISQIEDAVWRGDGDASRASPGADAIVITNGVVALLHQAGGRQRLILARVVAVGQGSHVVAEAMREISRVDTRVDPASNAVGNAKGYRARVVDPADEEGIMSGLGTGGPNPRRSLNPVVGAELKDVAGRIIRTVFGDEGGRNVIGNAG